MEPPAFWRDLETHFRELGSSEGAFDLHAILDNTDLQEYALEERQRAERLRQDPSAHPVQIESMLRHAERIEEAARQAALETRDPDGYWVISGGPSDIHKRAVLHQSFEALAARSAIGAEAVPSGADPVQAWLHLMKRNGSPFSNDLWFERLCEDSALMCRKLETRAYQATKAAEPAATAPLTAELITPHAADPVHAPKVLTWPDLTIEFISSKECRVTMGEERDTYNYAALGCEDQRTKQPDGTWILLRDVVATNNGLLTGFVDAELTATKISTVRKRIRKFLARHGVTIQGDGFPYKRSTGYRAKFIIRRAASFDS